MDYIGLVNNDYIKSNYTKIGNELIIQKLADKNIKGSDLAIDLEYWSDEEDFSKYATFIPGCIYIFHYDDEEVTQGDLKYHDVFPMFLCLSNRYKGSRKYVYGLNLNLLSIPARACILQEVNDLDEDFFDNKLYDEHSKGNHVFSETIMKTFQNDSGVSFLKYVTSKYRIKQKTWAARRYYLDKITKYRLIDYWMWKYIPFVSFKNGIRGIELSKIIKDNIQE